MLTNGPDHELPLTIANAVNQAENEQRSENIKLGLKCRAESGDSGLYNRPCYGYKKNEEGTILLPGFGYRDMKGVVNDSEIAIKLDADPYDVKDKLNQLRSKLEKEFSLTPIPDITWEMAVDRFIKEVNGHTENATSLRPEIKALIIKAAANNGTISTMADIAYGKRIEIGKERLASEVENRREYAKWSAALDEAICQGLINRENKNWCELTDKGYIIAEEACEQ